MGKHGKAVERKESHLPAEVSGGSRERVSDRQVAKDMLQIDASAAGNIWKWSAGPDGKAVNKPA